MYTINIHKFLTVVSILIFTTIALQAQIPEDCADRQHANSWPEYYCDCKYTAEDFTLPIDTNISHTIWFKGTISNLAQGISAYLHSDSPMKFEVYPFCTSKTAEYEKIFEPNQANSIDGTSIKQRLEEAGYGSTEGTFYICVSPVFGIGGRLILRSEADGMPSSCDNPLYIFPGMSLYSTQPTDVYVIDPSNIGEATDIIIHWDGDNNTPCELLLTSNSCDGAVVDEVTLDATNNCYTLTAEVLDEAWFNDEKFYLHFNHAPNTAGFVHCLVPEYAIVCTDTTICQGMGIQLADTLLTESTTYLVDTVFLHTNQYRVNCLNLTVVEPDIQPDTLAFKYTHQPYIYRGQHTINQPGKYDLTIHTPGQCDERYMLHVYHDVDTLINVRDTTICYGGSFLNKGKNYKNDVAFAATGWLDDDTYFIDSLYVYFDKVPNLIYDTINVNERKYGQLFDEEGDYRLRYPNPITKCTDSVVLHVRANTDGMKYVYEYIDEELCQGKVYDYWGDEYTSSICFNDTNQITNDTFKVTVVTLIFTEPEPQYETVEIKSSNLPYPYRGHTITAFGEYDITIHKEGKCDERYILNLIHDIDTIREAQTITLCQGKAYVHNGVVYAASTILVDTLQLDADTYQILTTNVLFTAPEIIPDTLALKTTDLPYTYRNQYVVDDFGEHDVLISLPDVCDEHYALYVWHDIDTIVMEIDTFLCYGNTFIYDNIEYVSDTTLVFTKEALDTLEIENLNIYFSKVPEQVYDTITLAYNELPYLYRDQYEVTSYGDHEFELKNSEGCVEWMLLHVLGELPTALIEQNLKDQPQLILQDGIVYIVRGKERYTLLGERL